MIQNQITVYCEAVGSAILATAWLLVTLWPSPVPGRLPFVSLQNPVNLKQALFSLSSNCDVCIVAKRCIIEQSYYWQPTGSRIWEIDWYQNEWPWPLFRGRLRWFQPLRHIHHWISQKLLETEAKDHHW